MRVVINFILATRALKEIKVTIRLRDTLINIKSVLNKESKHIKSLIERGLNLYKQLADTL
jgi:hypothetical protein